MMGPNEVLKGVVLGLAAVAVMGASVISAVAFHYRKKVIKAEKLRFELTQLRAEQERREVHNLHLHSEDHETVLSR